MARGAQIALRRYRRMSLVGTTWNKIYAHELIPVTEVLRTKRAHCQFVSAWLSDRCSMAKAA